MFRIRAYLLGAAVLPIVGGGAWLWAGHAPPRPAAAPIAADEPLPIPPVPPRIATGRQYDQCLSMLANDPAGANSFAESWQAAGGGDGAAHCRALAQIALGNAEAGAEMMERLAAASHAPEVARASIYGQAGEAWMMAGDTGQAFAAATMALALSPDDPDLLVDRAVAAEALHQYRNAVDDLDRALDLEPKRVDGLVYRASAERGLNRLESASADIDAALRLDPDNAEALLERGILRQRRGDNDGARGDWERATTLSPDTATGDLAQQNLALLDVGPRQ